MYFKLVFIIVQCALRYCNDPQRKSQLSLSNHVLIVQIMVHFVLKYKFVHKSRPTRGYMTFNLPVKPGESNHLWSRPPLITFSRPTYSADNFNKMLNMCEGVCTCFMVVSKTHPICRSQKLAARH